MSWQEKCKKDIEDFISSINTDMLEKKENYTTIISIYNNFEVRFQYPKDKLLKIVNLIIKNKEMYYYQAEENLSNDILNIIKKNRFIKNESIEEVTKKVIKAINASPQNFLCLIPVYGIEQITNLKFSNHISLCPAKNKDHTIIKYWPDYSTHLFESENAINDFACVTINNTYKFSVINKSIEYLNTIFNTFQLLWGDLLNPLNIGISYKKTNKNMLNPFFVLTNKQKDCLIDYPEYTHVRISRDILTDNQLKILRAIGKIIDKKIENFEISKVEQNIYIAVNYIGSALTETDRLKRILNFMSAIEALIEQKHLKVKGKKISITRQITKISTQILEKDKDKKTRNDFEKRMKKLYGKRSNLTHGETEYVTFDDLVFIKDVSIELCLFFINMADDLSKRTSLETFLKELYINSKVDKN